NNGMKVWIDANLPPSLALWLGEEFGDEAHSAERLDLLRASDLEIFQKARDQGAVLLTKDSDFVDLVTALVPPTMVVWFSCGNTTNTKLKMILLAQWVRVRELIQQGHPIVELTDSIK
ncbi:MAG: DUF5615 family PIN-like protein, partial [Phycisphaerae bacterium]